MAEVSDFEALDVEIRAANGRFVAQIPQVHLFATGTSRSEALAAVEKKKTALIEELRQQGLLETFQVNERASPAERGRRHEDFSWYGAKIALTVFLIALALWASSSLLIRQASKEAQAVADRFGAVVKSDGSLLNKFARETARAAAMPDLPDDEKEKLLNDLRVVVERWRPYVREAASLFENRAGVRDAGSAR